MTHDGHQKSTRITRKPVRQIYCGQECIMAKTYHTRKIHNLSENSQVPPMWDLPFPGVPEWGSIIWGLWFVYAFPWGNVWQCTSNPEAWKISVNSTTWTVSKLADTQHSTDKARHIMGTLHFMCGPCLPFPVAESHMGVIFALSHGHHLSSQWLTEDSARYIKISYGGFQYHGYPIAGWWIFHGKSQSKMDDDWGYLQDSSGKHHMSKQVTRLSLSRLSRLWRRWVHWGKRRQRLPTFHGEAWRWNHGRFWGLPPVIFHFRLGISMKWMGVPLNHPFLGGIFPHKPSTLGTPMSGNPHMLGWGKPSWLYQWPLGLRGRLVLLDRL